jgi:hypothetical protein
MHFSTESREQRTLLPLDLREKPGGSGMLDVDDDGRGNGELSSTTQVGAGRGGRACEVAMMR